MRDTHSQQREARVRLVHSRTRLAFLPKNYAATSFVEEAASENFCPFQIIFGATRVDPWYLYEASLKIVGFVLLHKVPKEKTDRRVF